MDRTDNDVADVEGALHDIRLVNRFLGGSQLLVDAARPFLLAAPEDAPFSVLDVGTGGADLPLALVAAARTQGRAIRIVAIDRDPAVVRYARSQAADTPEIEVIAADAFELPFTAASFDLVTASLFLHHFKTPDAVRLVAGFLRIARRAVLINDLRRHVVPWAFIALAGRVSRRHPMFVHDAPLSVLRGFTEDELAGIAKEAGAVGASVVSRFPFRLMLTAPVDDHS